jgi:protein-disulfide isomerase
VNYKTRVVSIRILGPFALAWLFASCGPKARDTVEPGPLQIDKSGEPAVAIDTTPLDNVDISAIDSDRQTTFYRLVTTLPSPCGKAHSLRTSYTGDPSCKRARFAVRWLVAMLQDEIREDLVRQDYRDKYENIKRVKLDARAAPTFGPPNAAVRIVEFFDYACPHCNHFKPILDEVMAKYDGKIVVSFMMFPLGHWPYSHSAARASLAAHTQGKFKEMHAMLFAKGAAHSKPDVLEYAKLLGLDLVKFEAAYEAAGPRVDLDKKIGNDAGVESTPTIYVNDRKYVGPMVPKYIGFWIEEELDHGRG